MIERVRIRSRSAVLAALATALLALAPLAADPAPAHAALKSAAGGGSAGGGGFGALGSFMDHITTYLIWLAVPGCGLVAVVGGLMIGAGHRAGVRVCVAAAVGFAIAVSAKGIAA